MRPPQAADVYRKLQFLWSTPVRSVLPFDPCVVLLRGVSGLNRDYESELALRTFRTMNRIFRDTAKSDLRW